jgi:hypothetical protein
MAIPVVIMLYVLVLAGLGGRLWYACGRVSAAQQHVITRSTLRLVGVATALALLVVALLVVAAAS